MTYFRIDHLRSWYCRSRDDFSVCDHNTIQTYRRYCRLDVGCPQLRGFRQFHPHQCSRSVRRSARRPRQPRNQATLFLECDTILSVGPLQLPFRDVPLWSGARVRKEKTPAAPYLRRERRLHPREGWAHPSLWVSTVGRALMMSPEALYLQSATWNLWTHARMYLFTCIMPM